MARQAVILAGGKGTRLRPFTATLPKPLVPVGDHPIIAIVLRQLKHFGFRDIVISTGHLAELIEAYCGDGRKWGVKIRYCREDKPLGTAGSLKLIRGLQPRFLTINGDVLTNLDYAKLFDRHVREDAEVTVAVQEREYKVDFGVLDLDSRDRLKTFREKPSHTYLVSMGINAISRRSLKHLKAGEAAGIPDLIARAQADGGVIQGFRNKAHWLDIGRPQDYETAQELFTTPGGRARYLRS